MAVVDGLITLADAKSQLGIPLATTTYDTDLEIYVMAATPIIQRYTGPMLLKTRTFTMNGNGPAIVLPTRISSVVSVTESGTAITDFHADLDKGILYGGSTAWASRSFISGVQNVVVVVTVGSSTIASNIQLAARELVRFWWQVGRQANRPGVAEQVIAENDVPSGLLKRVEQLCSASPDVPGFA